MYDVTKKETFQSLPRWLADTLSTSKNNIVLLMIGNKTDLEEKYQAMTQAAGDHERSPGLRKSKQNSLHGDFSEEWNQHRESLS